MLKYKVGQRVKTYSGTLGYIVEVDLGWPQPYRVKLDTGFELWIREDGLSIDLDFLQAENERLKAALEKLLMVSHYTSDAHPKRGIECKRCAQWGITRADVIHLDWCEVGEAKDMLKNEVKP